MYSHFFVAGLLVVSLSPEENLIFYHFIYRTAKDNNLKPFFINYKGIYKKVLRATKVYEIICSFLNSGSVFKKASKTTKDSTNSRNINKKIISLEMEDKLVTTPTDVSNKLKNLFHRG